VAISGTWLAGAVTPSEYAGATRWGTGVNPVHALWDEGPGRGPTKLPLGSEDPSGAVAPGLASVELFGYHDEDAQYYQGEDYRYMEDDHPNWGDTTVGRADRDGVIMQYGTQPDPTGFPSWGPHGLTDADWSAQSPLPGHPGGAELRAESEGSEVEHLTAMAVPTRGVTGGWLNKTHGEVAYQVDSDPAQLLVTTSEVQLRQVRVNDSAVARQTDDPRSPIDSRLTGQKVKHYAKSSGMGGGPGTPDMGPVTQDLPYRPWFFRTPAVPPPPDTTYGTMTGTEPLERIPPVDAGELVTTTETGQQVTASDFTDQDYYA